MSTTSELGETSDKATQEKSKQPGMADEIEAKQAILKSVLKKLAYFNRATADILEAYVGEQTKRQHSVLKEKLNEAHDLIQDIQCLKIDAEEEDEIIDQWTNETKKQLQTYEIAVGELSDKLTEEEKELTAKQHNEKIMQEAEIREQRRREEEKAEQERRKRDEQFALALEEKKLEIAEKRRIQTKLPQLEISEFQGTHLDWVRFWNLFTTQVDQAPLKDEAKFAYLKELIQPKVRATIEKLPHNSDGYKRAKEMLQQRYGDSSEVVNAHIQQILSLPTINGTPKTKIHSFYDNLSSHVQALETLGKLGDVAGNVRMTLDKLEGIRSDLIRTDANWKKWTFGDLVEALREWVERNPLHQGDKDTSQKSTSNKREKSFSTKDNVKLRQCVYCDDENHRSTDCTKITDIGERRKILSNKRRCFNCTGEKHRASECRSKIHCYHCNRRHHTSICSDKDKPSSERSYQVNESKKEVVFPVIMVKVEGVECRALLDTGSGTSYASTTLINATRKQPARQESKIIEMMLHTTTRKVDVYELEISDVKGKFKMPAEVNQVDKNVLLTLPNPRYKELIATHEHLRGVYINDDEEKENLPVHLILGASEISRIKTTVPARIGREGMPVAEKTTLGWTIMSPGQPVNHSYLMFTRNSHDDYMQLCSLDVLGLEDRADGDQESVYQEFKEQLSQREDGKYETSLPWKASHPQLPTNRHVARRRLDSLLNRLEKQPCLFEKYHDIIQEQKAEGIIEEAPEQLEGPREHYIPHKPVVREQAETTKVRVVYDASAKATDDSPSLNECLDVGPPLQRKILDILLRIRMKPILLAGDIKQAFLQIVIRETERDAMRFLWIDDMLSKREVVYRMTRAMFGLGPSPFLLGGTLTVHLQKYSEKYPGCVEELDEGTYVDDINIAGDTVAETREMKEQAKEILGEGSFTLHKWHSNAPDLESDEVEDGESTYAKESLGTRPCETKLLGLEWNKIRDTLSVSLQQPEEQPTKRVVLRTMARIYDPLGLATPILLTAKVLFRDICDKKLAWDAELPTDLVSNLLSNTTNVLKHLPIQDVYAWTDSTVSLYWIKGQGNYKQFVANRVKKINEHKAEWRHVPSKQNPADIGSRGSTRELQANEL